MKYKCIKPYYMYDICVMNIGDIVYFKGNKIINITVGTEFTLYTMDDCKQHLEIISDSTDKVNLDCQAFKDIINTMYDIFIKKNHDYGNSFEQSLDEEGLAASRIRMGDKWNRFKQLSKGVKAQVNDESIRDTLLDMANYAIMTVMWLDKK